MDHPNIIKLHTHFEDQEFINLVLDYASGGTLLDIIKKNGRINEKTCLGSMFFLNSCYCPCIFWLEFGVDQIEIMPTWNFLLHGGPQI